MKENEKMENLFSLLLDSSLITATNRVEYDTKIVLCGDYVQLYTFKKRKKIDKDLEVLDFSVPTEKQIKIEKENKKKLKDLMLYKKENLESRGQEEKIEYKNLLRSKFQMERLIKSNEKEFKTFITLTFADNIKDIKEANKKIHIWCTYIKRLKNDFKYIGVPEFQKRGAVHYHFLTNINYNDFSLLSKEERKIYNKKSGWQIGRDVKGWLYGHCLVKYSK